jgi:hypothetical protein
MFISTLHAKGGTQVAVRRKATAYERAGIAKDLVLGLPPGMSLDGAMALDVIAGYLCDLRVMTLDQIVRMLPGQKKTTVRYWLERYPYIRMRKIQAHYYDGKRGKWIKAIKVGAYSLTREGLAGYDIASRYQDETGKIHRRKIAEPPSASSKSIESLIQAAELYTRLFEVTGEEYGWLSNVELQDRWRQEGILDAKETLNTTGYIRRPLDAGGEELWGVSVQTKSDGNILMITQRAYPKSRADLVQGMTFAKHGDLSKVLSSICRRKAKVDVDHVRFMPYEFTWHHPRWFKSVLDGNRWAVLDALLEYHRSAGHDIIDRIKRYGGGYGRDNPYRFQVTRPDGNGGRIVEYIDTTYGAPAGEVRALIESRKRQIAPKTTQYPERYVLYVASEGELRGLTEAAAYYGAGVELRLIDWPGGR